MIYCLCFHDSIFNVVAGSAQQERREFLSSNILFARKRRGEERRAERASWILNRLIASQREERRLPLSLEYRSTSSGYLLKKSGGTPFSFLSWAELVYIMLPQPPMFMFLWGYPSIHCFHIHSNLVQLMLRIIWYSDRGRVSLWHSSWHRNSSLSLHFSTSTTFSISSVQIEQQQHWRV